MSLNRFSFFYAILILVEPLSHDEYGRHSNNSTIKLSGKDKENYKSASFLEKPPISLSENISAKRRAETWKEDFWLKERGMA